MRILGVDYGRAKIGLAIAQTGLADPFLVVRIKSWEDALGKIEQTVRREEIDKVVVGVSEGETGIEQQRFAAELNSRVNISVETFDEGLTTLDAQRMALEAGLGRKKRREMEDAYAAAVMLQSYLEGQNSKF